MERETWLGEDVSEALARQNREAALSLHFKVKKKRPHFWEHLTFQILQKKLKASSLFSSIFAPPPPLELIVFRQPFFPFLCAAIFSFLSPFLSPPVNNFPNTPSPFLSAPLGRMTFSPDPPPPPPPAMSVTNADFRSIWESVTAVENVFLEFSEAGGLMA